MLWRDKREADRDSAREKGRQKSFGEIGSKLMVLRQNLFMLMNKVGFCYKEKFMLMKKLENDPPGIVASHQLPTMQIGWRSSIAKFVCQVSVSYFVPTPSWSVRTNRLRTILGPPPHALRINHLMLDVPK